MLKQWSQERFVKETLSERPIVHGKRVMSPIQQLDGKEREEYLTALSAKRSADGSLALSSLPEETLPLSALWTPQRSVHPMAAATKVKTVQSAESLIGTVACWRGKLILIDGNHRSACALLLGQSEGRFKVLHLDATAVHPTSSKMAPAQLVREARQSTES